jgi:hypothetical protein
MQHSSMGFLVRQGVTHMKFAKQSCLVRTTMKQQTIPVMVCVESGLGYARIAWLKQKGCHLIHVRSGWFLCTGPQTAMQARHWIERLAPLTDWTQDEKVMRKLSQTFIRRVPEIRDEVVAEMGQEQEREEEREEQQTCQLIAPCPCVCIPCENMAHWQYNGNAVCRACMQEMSDMNGDNAAVFAVALREG